MQNRALLGSVDHFTRKPNRPTPRAAFLSHVHKDHLVGLETYDASFIYCSQATKEVMHIFGTIVDWESCFYVFKPVGIV